MTAAFTKAGKAGSSNRTSTEPGGVDAGLQRDLGRARRDRAAREASDGVDAGGNEPRADRALEHRVSVAPIGRDLVRVERSARAAVQSVHPPPLHGVREG